MNQDSVPLTEKRGIVVVEYDPAWPSTFEAIKNRFELLLAGFVEEIEHVGSTSVPGLCAKPKIDVDIVLQSEESISVGIERLQQSGYTYHGNKYNDGMWAFTSGRGSYGERIYLCGPGNLTHMKRLVFRDYLRTHPLDAAAYGDLKMRLASCAGDDWDYYTGNKGPFVLSILRRAAAELVDFPTEVLEQLGLT